MRLVLVDVGLRVGLPPPPTPIFERPESVAERGAAARRSAELDGELTEHVLSAEVTAGAGDLMPKDLRIGEVLEEGDEVGKRLVKRKDIAVPR